MYADQIEMMTTGCHTVGVPVATEGILVIRGIRMIVEIIEIVETMVIEREGSMEPQEVLATENQDRTMEVGPGHQGAVAVKMRIRRPSSRWAEETIHQ